MEATVKRDDFLKVVKMVKAASTTRNIPSFSYIKLEVEKGALTLTAGDGVHYLTVKVPSASGLKAGAVCVDKGDLLDVVTQMKVDSITLQRKGQRHTRYVANPNDPENPKPDHFYTYTLVVSGNQARVKLNAVAPQDFPFGEKVTGTKITISKVAEDLQLVTYAAAKEDTRPVLTSICLSQPGKQPEYAAADGFRLAVTKAHVKGKLPRQVLIPLATAKLLEKLGADTVAMVVGETHISMSAGEWTLTAFTPDGTFPRYQQLIPTGGSRLVVEKKAILDAIKQVRMPGGSTKTAHVRLLTKGQRLVVSSKTDDREAEAILPTTGKCKIAFNPDYLVDTINHLGDQVVMQSKSPSSPALFRANGTAHVLMPFFVQW